MKGYSFLAICVILVQAQPTGPNGIPCDSWAPGPGNPCLPPDPRPFFHFTVALCFSIAIAALGAYLARALKRERRIVLNEDEARQWSERLCEALRGIGDLRGLALRKKCITIVKGLLVGVDYTLQSVREYYVDCRPTEDDALWCIAAIIQSGRDLRDQLGLLHFTLILPSLAPYASRQTLKAVQQYKEFVELIQRCSSNLPGLVNTLSILEFRDDGVAE